MEKDLLSDDVSATIEADNATAEFGKGEDRPAENHHQRCSKTNFSPDPRSTIHGGRKVEQAQKMIGVESPFALMGDQWALRSPLPISRDPFT